MKRIKFYLLIILSCCAFVCQTAAQSTDSLGVIYISPDYPQCPDTAFLSQQSGNITVRIFNYTATTYVGQQLYVKFDASDTTNQLFLAKDSFLLNAGATVTIPALDSVDFSLQGAITFDTLNYKLGSNVVIVWPTTTNGVLKYNPYTACINMFNTLGIKDFDNINSSFIVGPNPTNSKIKLLPELQNITESVRIYDVLGRIVYTEKLKNSTVPVEFLNPGMYILEIVTKNNQRLRKQFLKE